jgi:NAD(P)-dependent dehydrogenase (short-subunit alcohol dehydrogenase family)
VVSPKSRLFLVARSREKALEAANEITSVFANYGSTITRTSSDSNYNQKIRKHLNGHKKRESQPTKTIFPMVCDHSSFDSVRDFCAEMKNELRLLSELEGYRIGIDVLCLNAAVLLGEDSEVQFTQDNLELTIQTNHFSPFLIANTLLDFINVGARVVVTSSGLHAFENFGNFEGVIDPKTGKVEAGFQTIAGSSFDYKKCYAVSKLCNVAFCLELDRRLRERNAKAICFSPGLIPTSGLFRHQKRWDDTAMKKLRMGMGETEEWGGVFLAWMAISDKAFGKGGCYWRAPFGISRRGGKIPDDLFLESLNEELTCCKNRETLWKISSILTGSTFERHVG